MQDLRYPVGRFERPSSFTPELRQQWVQQIAAVPAELRRAVAGLSEAQLDTPYREGGWTVRQVVHHLADSHLNSYIRFRWTLTEERPTIKPYEEARWAELHDAKFAPIEVSLVLLEALHDRWVRLLGSIDDWQRTLIHPEAGVQDLNTLLALYAWHGRHHIAHITSLRERMGW